MKKIALVCVLAAITSLTTGCLQLDLYSELTVGGGSPMAASSDE